MLPLPCSWNTLSQIFDTESKEAIDPRAADNILIAWPEMLQLVEGSNQILDFGCGTGAFARKLQSRGQNVLGIDSAEEMISIAEKQSRDIPFIVGSVDDIPQELTFDAITSIMVFQFIEDIEAAFSKLVSHLKSNGRLVFAVHSKDFLDNAEKTTTKYFQNETGKSFIRFKEYGAVELHKRSAQDYAQVLESLGMKKERESTPAFPDAYLAKYANPQLEPLDVPKFLIMSFIR